MVKSDIILNDIRFYAARAISSGDKSTREYFDEEVNRLLTKLLLSVYREEADKVERKTI